MTRTQVWRWVLRQPGPIRTCEVATEFGATVQAASNLLQRLAKAGAVKRNGKTHHRAAWVVVDRHADIYDGRGYHANSLRNLRPRWKKTTGAAHPHERSYRRDDWPAAPDICAVWR